MCKDAPDNNLRDVHMHQHWNFPSPHSGIQMSCETRSQLFDLDACPSTSTTQKARGRPPLIYIRDGYSIKTLILEQLCMVPRGGGRVLRQRVSRSWPRASPNFWITQMVSFICFNWRLPPMGMLEAALSCLHTTVSKWRHGHAEGIRVLESSAN